MAAGASRGWRPERGYTRRVALSDEAIEALIREKGLRVTATRVAVLRLLQAKGPLSHTEAVAELGDARWDKATIYRNLISLADAGLALVVSNAGGMARYAYAEQADHSHPHFECTQCGQVSCLPHAAPKMNVQGRWAASIDGATMQLRGRCPDCLET